jgi:hypothetical protein
MTVPPVDRTLWNHEALERLRQSTDPVGDRVVAECGSEILLAGRLLESLMRLGDAPAETTELLAGYRRATRHLPPWADRATIELAQQVLAKNFIAGTLLLSAASLPQCYLDARGTPVLAATHQLTQHVFRRLFQTAHMVFTVCAPGSLSASPEAPDAIPPGIEKAQTVRLIHALMRHLLLAEGGPRASSIRSIVDALWAKPWDTARLGKPINQEDEAFVLLTFSYVVIEGFDRLGVRITDAERQAILHLWNVVGFVLGVHEGLMAHTYEDAAELYALLKSRLRGPSEEGVLLTRGLVGWMNRLLPSWLEWFDAGSELIILLNGEDDAALLGVRPAAGIGHVVHRVLATTLRPLERAAERLGVPHALYRVTNLLATKMLEEVWEEAQKSQRKGSRIHWPEQVRELATSLAHARDARRTSR